MFLYFKPITMILWCMHKMLCSSKYNYTKTGRYRLKCASAERSFSEKVPTFISTWCTGFLLYISSCWRVQSQHRWILSGLIFFLSEKVFAAICSCNNFHRPENCPSWLTHHMQTDWFVNRTQKVVNGL